MIFAKSEILRREMSMLLTKKEESKLKREVKKKTGFNMKDIEIEMFGDHFIEFSFYKTNYDRVTHKKSYQRVER